MRVFLLMISIASVCRTRFGYDAQRLSSAAFDSTGGLGVAKPSGESNVSCSDLLAVIVVRRILFFGFPNFLFLNSLREQSYGTALHLHPVRHQEFQDFGKFRFIAT